jgi:hypothetical protein
MNPHTGQRRSFRIVCAILLVSMLLDRYLVSQKAPGLSGLLGFTPMVVFLDIPVDLPFTFGLLPVLTLFILFYTVFYFPYQSPDKTLAWEWLRRRLWRVITALSVIPFFVLSGGLLYSLAHDSLPRHLRNAIESFGLNADLYSPFPGHELIHFRGSMVMLLFFFPGLYICRRMIRNAAPYPATLHPDGHPAEPAIIRSYIPEPEAVAANQAPPERPVEPKPASNYSPYVNKRFVERAR